MADKYILRGRKTIKIKDTIEWAREFEKIENLRVAGTKLPGEVRVSTVFLGIDHQWGEGPPLLFETMIFGGVHDRYRERYSTWEEAEAGHAEAVKLASGNTK